MEVRNPSKNPSGIWVFDIEGDNLYDNIKKLHCAWAVDPVTYMAIGFRPNEMGSLIQYLTEAEYSVAHNGIDFDIPALRKFFNFGTVKTTDTLILASMLHPNRLSQSLESWGRDLDNQKDSFGKTADWSTFTEEMYEYCYQDVLVTVDLFRKLCSDFGIVQFYDEDGNPLEDYLVKKQMLEIPSLEM